MNKRKRKKLAKKLTKKNFWKNLFTEAWVSVNERYKELEDIIHEFQEKSKT